MTKIITDDEPLDIVLRGTEKLYKAVSVTMGPRGRNVVFRQPGKRVGITHDGVTVAKMIDLDDESPEDAAAEVLREASKQLDSTTGDGTTTVTVLTYNILKEAVEKIREGESPMQLWRELDAAKEVVLDAINEATEKDITLEKLQAIATTSSGSKEIGKEIGKVVFDAGSDTPIFLGFSGNEDTYVDVIKGFKIEAGPASPYLVDSAHYEIENPKIIVADATFRSKEDIMPILKAVATLPGDQRKFLLVCGDIASDALSLVLVNKLKDFADIAVARVPQHINSQTEYLADLALSCGATLLSKNTANSIKNPDVSHFGSARRVTVEPRETIIVDGAAIEEDMNVKIAELTKMKLSKEKSIRKFANDRLKTLEQRIISIYVGGQSESEAEEKHYRYEDALGATRAALRGGIVPGGGTLLFSIARTLDDSTASQILAKALKSPLIKVLENAGVELMPGEAEQVKPGFGIDVMHPEDGLVDLVQKGIIDPAESELECVKTAVSISGLLMTTGAMIIGEKDKNQHETQQPFSFSQS